MRNENGAPPPPSTHRKVASFEDLIAWQKARSLTKAVTELTGKPPVSRKFAFRDQIERAAVSVMSNIAEGYERGSRAEFHHMLRLHVSDCVTGSQVTLGEQLRRMLRGKFGLTSYACPTHGGTP